MSQIPNFLLAAPVVAVALAAARDLPLQWSTAVNRVKATSSSQRLTDTDFTVHCLALAVVAVLTMNVQVGPVRCPVCVLCCC